VLSEMETLCDLWEAEPSVHLSHSQLYHLEPIGIGSPLVECLTSYVARLSGEHSVSASTLVRKQILPALSRPLLNRDGSMVDTFLGQQSVALNGLTETARIFVQALEELTLRNDLSLLTMLPYQEALSGVSLLRRTKAWCCTCYEEWREAGQVIYEPLLWLLSVVTLCPRHALPLEVRCPNPDCARQQFPLTAQGQPGYCPWCRRWLGSKKTCNPLKLTDEEQAEQLQNGELVGALLAATSHASVRCWKGLFAWVISTCVDQIAEGKASVLAHLLPVESSTIQHWQCGRNVPQLETLVKVAATLNMSLFDLLMGEVNVLPISPTMRQERVISPTRSRKRRKPRVTKQQRREALEAVIRTPEDPPPSVQAVASRLQYDYSRLTKDFPNLCHTISDRYARYRAKQRVERQQRLCGEVRQAVLLVHTQGRYPSKRQVSKLLTAPASFWDPEVNRTWKEMIQQLG